MNQSPRPYVLHEANYKQLLDYKPNVAVLPWGATEAHNYHLPHGTDVVQATEFAIDAARLAYAEGAKPIVLPVYHAIEEPESGGIAMNTSSINDLIEILSASIDVSEEHRISGLAVEYPAPGLAGQEVRIQRSGHRPANASVAVKYRQSWFYIDETDQSTKLMFRVLRTLWQDRIASTAQLQPAPVLTIPVSR